MYRPWEPPACFAAAAHYLSWRPRPGCLIREGADSAGFTWSERHLRCVWADAAYRPSPLITHDGQRVTVEYPGRWNLEAGPDFLDAVVRLEPGARCMRGDVELHVRPADWIHHGHARDSRYRSVRLHVTYFPGSLPAAELPPGTAQVSLQEGLRQNPLFSFEALDVLAYPYAQVDPRPPCALVLSSWSAWEKAALLAAAGTERLRRKAERLSNAIREKGADQVLYEEILCGLGYKHNRAPCRTLAVRLPLESLRHESGPGDGAVTAAYALLCGVAGLLPTRLLPHWEKETRRFVRTLWDIWWKKQTPWEPAVLAPDQWVLHALRPHNHPLRRLMAAAELFCGRDPLPRSLEKLAHEEGANGQTIVRLLEATGLQGYWARHQSLAGTALARPSALIGPGRAAALLTNAIAPWMTVMYPEAPVTQRLLDELPPEDDNRLIRHTAHALFGHDHNPSLYRCGLRQQGLLQLFHDFCLDSRGGCGTCALPGLLLHQKQYDAVAST
jgi:hypothetical protein